MTLLEFYQQFFTNVERKCKGIGNKTQALNPNSRSIQTGVGNGCTLQVIWADPEVGRTGRNFPRELRLQLIQKTHTPTEYLASYVKKYPPFPQHPELSWSKHERKEGQPPQYNIRFPTQYTQLSALNDPDDINIFVERYQTPELFCFIARLMQTHEAQFKEHKGSIFL